MRFLTSFINTKHFKTLGSSILFTGLLCSSSFAQQPSITEKETSNDPVFARINDRTIHLSEFMGIFQNAVRYKYYHGEVPQKELQAFQKKVGNDIVKQILLYQEAQKIGLEADMEKITSGLKQYEEKYRNDPRDKAIVAVERAKMITRLKQKDLFDQIKINTRNIAQPNDSQVFEFYKNNADKFTEPKRVWVSVILLSVPPSSVNQVWVDAKKTASEFKFRIQEGEDYAEMARKFSGHASSVNGGDLGYLHEGMLDGNAKDAVNKLKISELSDPVRVLEGFTLFKLNGIQPAKLKPFEEVKKRASGLLYRQLQDDIWASYTQKLIETADIQIDESLYAVPIDEK